MSLAQQTQSALSSLIEKVRGRVVKPQNPMQVSIRPVSTADVDVVIAKANPMRSAETHRGRLKRQIDGDLVYLIAWDDDMPIGHGQIIWDGPLGSPKQHLEIVCPYIEDLWVNPRWRSRGVGASVVAQMESMAIARGHRHIGLSVGVGNTRAIRLYERLGYSVLGTPNFILSGTVADARGDQHFWSEECQYMLKTLSTSRDPTK